MKPSLTFAVGALVLGALAGQARAQYGYPYPSPAMPGYPMPGYGYPMPGYGAPQVVPVPLTPSGVPLPPPYAPPGMAVYGPLETLQGSPIVTPAQQPHVSVGTQTAVGARGPVQGRTVSQNKDGEMLPAPMGAQPAAPMAAAPMETEHNAWTQPCFDGCGRRHKSHCKDACADDESRCGLVLFMGLDAWGGIADQRIVQPGGGVGSGFSPGEDNFGLHHGFNLGVGLLESWGVGFQVGASWGHYDWDGRVDQSLSSVIFFSSPVDVDNSEWQSQAFFTTGFFKRSDVGPAFTAALVMDYMINKNYGPFAMEPSLRQWRALLGVPVGDQNEIGAWAAVRDGRSSQDFLVNLFPIGPTNFSITWQAVSHYNLYWRHRFAEGGEGMIYAGLFDQSRHGLADGSLGTWSLGASLEVPISDHVSVYANAAYMNPSATANSISSTANSNASLENAYNLSVGLAWYPCNCLRSCKRGWLPVMPVANNGTFLVDTSGVVGSAPPPLE